MVDLIPLEGLARALDLGHHEHVAVVGGGGKTTVVHALGHQLRGTRVLTCTTKMGAAEHRGRPVLLDPSPDQVRAAAEGPDGPVVVGWQTVQGPKAVGVTPDRCDAWFEVVDHVVVEADGSKQRPFKAPAGFEPVVPSTTTVMVSVIGADALGRVIADQCHRPLRVAALAGCQPYQRLTPAGAATVLLHPRGARKELPSGARLVVLVTKVSSAGADARTLVDELQTELARREPAVPALVVGPPAAGADLATGPTGP